VVEAVQIAAAVADALAHAHSRSVVHRDVKPSNVVFAEDRRPVLVDFGLALTDMDVAAERGIVSGTPAFMSPEQAGGRGHRPDGRTDVYGLAATLYAMLCGRSPFRGRSHADIFRQVREDEPQPPRQLRPDLPLELERVCLKGMAKLPGEPLHDRGRLRGGAAARGRPSPRARATSSARGRHASVGCGRTGRGGSFERAARPANRTATDQRYSSVCANRTRATKTRWNA